MAACTSTADHDASTDAALTSCPPVSVFGTRTPAVTSDPDTSAVELGMKFRVSAAGAVDGVRFYKGSANTGTHVGKLYSRSGQLLASVTFTGETSSGWQTARFAMPVAVTAGETYVVSYYAPGGEYAGDVHGLAAAATDPTGFVTALADGTDGSNGVYHYGAGGGFPSSTYEATNYYVDVLAARTDCAPAVDAGTDGSAPLQDAAAPDAGNPAPAPDAGAPTPADAGAGADGGRADGGTRTTDCFAAPGACGYPDPSYGTVGSTTPCDSLPSSGSVTVSTNGQTVQNLNITGTLTISAANVIVDDVCVTTSGNTGALAVVIGSGASNLLLEHSTFRGTASTGTGVIDTGVWNASDVPTVTGKALYIYNAAESWHGAGTLVDSYLQAGAFYDDSSGPSHNEDVYLSDSSWTGDHDTLLNSQSQTAVFFGDNNGGAKGTPGDNHWTVTNSLIAGGGYWLYANAGATGVGSSTMSFTNNRIARCKTTAVYDGYGNTCSGGPDQYGYYPNGGYYGGPVDDDCPPTAGQVWSNNVWDDDGSPIACQ